MTEGGSVNGIELDRLKELVEGIQANPSRAVTHWSARVEWSGRGTASRAHIRHFPPLPFDEPPALAGADAAPNPVEQVLAALGACLTTTFVAHASVQGIPLESVEVDLHGDIDLLRDLGPDLLPVRRGRGRMDDLEPEFLPVQQRIRALVNESDLHGELSLLPFGR